MSQIDDLIFELCPAGVTFREIGDVILKLRTGLNPRKNFVLNSPGATNKYITVRELGGFSLNVTDKTDLIDKDGLDRIQQRSKLTVGDILFSGTGTIGRTALVGSEPLDWNIKEGVYAITPNSMVVDSRFLIYILHSSSVVNRIRVFAEGSTVASISMSKLRGIRIPVPPLEVQREIVRVLDTFTDLEADLEAELEARHKQYEYYAGELLSAGPNVPRVKLGDVATVVRGASPRPIQRFLTEDPDGVPWIKIGDVPATGKYITSTRQRIAIEGAERSRRVMPGDFVLSNSMSFGRPYISKIEGYIHDGWLAISGFEESYLSDYLYYLLRSEQVQVEFRRRAGAGTVKNLNSEIVRSVEISLPPRATQEKVVALLDKFDALVNDSSAGIPAELNARRMQYEYYRDRLLTFDEAPL